MCTVIMYIYPTLTTTNFDNMGIISIEDISPKFFFTEITHTIGLCATYYVYFYFFILQQGDGGHGEHNNLHMLNGKYPLKFMTLY